MLLHDFELLPLDVGSDEIFQKHGDGGEPYQFVRLNRFGVESGLASAHPAQHFF